MKAEERERGTAAATDAGGALVQLHIRKKFQCICRKLLACLVVFLLCSTRICLVTLHAEGTLDVIQEGETKEEMLAQKAALHEDFYVFTEDTVSGNDLLSGGGITGSDEELSGDMAAEESGMLSEEGTENGGGPVPGGGSADGNDAASDENTVSGNDVPGGGTVSGNDVPGSGDTVSGNDVPGSGDTVSGNDVPDDEDTVNGNESAPDEDAGGNSAGEMADDELQEEPEVQYTPEFFIEYHMAGEMEGILIGNASSVLTLSTVSSYMSAEGEKAGISPAVCAYGEAAGQELYADLRSGAADIALPDGFFGRVTLTAEDAEGNICEKVTPMILIDAAAPSVELTERRMSDGSKKFTAVIREKGAAVTGIAQVRCSVNDSEVEAADYRITEAAENCFGQAVGAAAEFFVEIEEPGIWTVRVEVSDHAGNRSSCIQDVEVTEKLGPISVSVPDKVGLTINPWTEGEQIYSDDLVIENRSGYDIVATLKNVGLAVNREDVNGDTLQKDCRVYLSGSEAGEILLSEGDSDNLLYIVIPAKKEDGENGCLRLQVHGTINGGSELYWKNGDVKLNLSFEYEAVLVPENEL